MFKISYVHIFDIDLEQLKKNNPPLLYQCNTFCKPEDGCRGENCHCLWVSDWFSPDQSGGKAVISFGLVGGFPLIHQEGKLSWPLG